MRILPTMGVPLLLAAATAQSPLTTLFASNGGGAPGGQCLFDLTVHSAVTITRLDVNSGSPAGTSGTIEVYLTPGTWAGNETNPAAWTLAGSGPCRAAGLDQPSPACIRNGIALAAGSYGVAVRYLGLEFRRTSGTLVVSTSELTLVAGAVQLVPWSTLFQPRIWNGSIHYLAGTVAGPFVCAEATTYGSGCGGLGLSILGSPLLGTTVILRATGIPPSSLLDANVLSFTQHEPGIDLTGIGAPGCFRYVGLDDTVYGTGSPTFDRLVGVPPAAILLGTEVFSQAAAFVPGSTPLGVIASDGARLRVGNS